MRKEEKDLLQKAIGDRSTKENIDIMIYWQENQPQPLMPLYPEDKLNKKRRPK